MFEGKEECRPDDDENEIRFYYNREERLKKAPRIVQNYYNGNFVLQKGVRAVFFKNKSNRFLLITLFALTAFAVVFGMVDKSQNKANLGDYKLELVSFSYEDEVYSTLKVTENAKKKKRANSDGIDGQRQIEERNNELNKRQPVVFNVEFRALNIDNQVVDIQKEERLIQNEEENFRTKITDFDIAEMQVFVTNGDENVKLYTGVKK